MISTLSSKNFCYQSFNKKPNGFTFFPFPLSLLTKFYNDLWSDEKEWDRRAKNQAQWLKVPDLGLICGSATDKLYDLEKVINFCVSALFCKMGVNNMSIS